MAITWAVAALLGLPMAYWATTNVGQSMLIHGDRMSQLDLDYEKLETNRAWLDYNERELASRQQNNQWDYSGQQQQLLINLENLRARQAELEQDKHEFEYYAQQHEVDYRRQLLGDYVDYQRDISKIGMIEGFDRLDRMQQSNLELSRQQHETGMYEAKAQQLAHDSENYILDQAMHSNLNDLTFGEPEPMEQVAYILSELQRMVTPERPEIPSFQNRDTLEALQEADIIFGFSNQLSY